MFRIGKLIKFDSKYFVVLVSFDCSTEYIDRLNLLSNNKGIMIMRYISDQHSFQGTRLEGHNGEHRAYAGKA